MASKVQGIGSLKLLSPVFTFLLTTTRRTLDFPEAAIQEPTASVSNMAYTAVTQNNRFLIRITKPDKLRGNQFHLS